MCDGSRIVRCCLYCPRIWRVTSGLIQPFNFNNSSTGAHGIWALIAILPRSNRDGANYTCRTSKPLSQARREGTQSRRRPQTRQECTRSRRLPQSRRGKQQPGAIQRGSRIRRRPQHLLNPIRHRLVPILRPIWISYVLVTGKMMISRPNTFIAIVSGM